MRDISMDNAIELKIREQQDKIIKLFKSIYYIQKYICCYEKYFIVRKIKSLETEINELINLELQQQSILELTNNLKLIYNKSRNYSNRLNNLKIRYYID